MRKINKSEAPLSHFISKNHTRYIGEAALAELKRLTSLCDADATNPERLFWIQNNLKDYPQCKACGKTLNSFHWCPFLKPEFRENQNLKSGYRQFCSRSCAYTFEGIKLAKMKATTLERYGVENAMQSPVVVEILKQTNLKRTGEEWPMRWSSPKFREKLKENHGVESIRAMAGVHKKIIESISKQTTLHLPTKIKELEKLFDVKCISNLSDLGQIYRIYDHEFKWEHTCGKTYESNISIRGLKKCPRCSGSTSKGEQEIGDYIESLGLEIVRRDRKVIAPQEIDIWIPSLKIGIEFDGTYWHSADFVSRTKSQEKLCKMEARGYRLITIQEHLWFLQKEKAREHLKCALDIFDKQILAETLLVKEMSKEESGDFLNKYHLQNTSKSATCFYGLFEQNNLISLMSFGKPRFNRKAKWELLRVATLPGVKVVGGETTLIKTFRNDHLGSIIGYADRCWSQGQLYKECGFRFISNNEPSYFWISGKHGVYSRYQTQRSKLPRLLENLNLQFSEHLSEEENMKSHRFLKNFDRGTSTWILE